MKTKKERTKAKIKNAYITLLKTHSPLSITVSDVCKECDINRSTFYEYYAYIDLLIDDVIYDQINAISTVNDVLYDSYYIENTTSPDYVAKYMQNIESNEVLMRFIKSNESNRFKAAITNAQSEYEINRYKITDTTKKIQVMYRNSGVLSIVFNWIEKKSSISVDEIAVILYNEIKKSEHK